MNLTKKRKENSVTKINFYTFLTKLISHKEGTFLKRITNNSFVVSTGRETEEEGKIENNSIVALGKAF